MEGIYQYMIALSISIYRPWNALLHQLYASHTLIRFVRYAAFLEPYGTLLVRYDTLFTRYGTFFMRYDTLLVRYVSCTIRYTVCTLSVRFEFISYNRWSIKFFKTHRSHESLLVKIITSLRKNIVIYNLKYETFINVLCIKYKRPETYLFMGTDYNYTKCSLPVTVVNKKKTKLPLSIINPYTHSVIVEYIIYICTYDQQNKLVLWLEQFFPLHTDGCNLNF